MLTVVLCALRMGRYVDWPSEPTAYESGKSFMHGPDILVRPITAALLPLRGSTDAAGPPPPATVGVWLPPSPTGGWLEWASCASGLVHGTAASGGSTSRHTRARVPLTRSITLTLFNH